MNALISSFAAVLTLAFNFQQISDCSKLKNLTLPGWEQHSFKYSFSFKYHKEKYTLYNVTYKGDTSGFVLKNDSENRIDVIYKGKCNPKNIAQINYLLNNNNSQREDNKDLRTFDYTDIDFKNRRYICNPDNLVVKGNYSQSSTFQITGCPEYINDVLKNGCAPTTGAMLISFYDRYSSYDLVKGLLPLKHNEDRPAVNKLIEELSRNMNYMEWRGVYWDNIKTGIERYLSRHSCSGYEAISCSGYDNYKKYLNYSSNPAICYTSGHAFLGVGYASLREYDYNGSQSVQDYLITHYNNPDHHGEYFINSNKMNRFYCISK